MADVIKDQAFAWNKYFKLFFLVVSALVNVTINKPWFLTLLVARKTHEK